MRQFWMLVFAFCAVALAGCSSAKLANGKYEARTPGREDYMVVYNDLVFLNIKTPSSLPDRNTYWMWAGKYSIGDNGTLNFDMPEEIKKQWMFSYSFVNQQGGVVLNDWENRNGIVLYYNKPQYRRIQTAPARMPETGGDFVR